MRARVLHRGALLLLLMAAACLQARAHCFQSCSGHGTCGADDVCTCFDGFSGAICEKSTYIMLQVACQSLICGWLPGNCPTGRSWVQKATAVDTAHNDGVECSRGGLCNYDTGECECFDRYAGSACERST